MIDDSGDRKDGSAAAFTCRQYLGRIGKTDNGIVTVTAVWADERVYYPVHAEPYCPAPPGTATRRTRSITPGGGWPPASPCGPTRMASPSGPSLATAATATSTTSAPRAARGSPAVRAGRPPHTRHLGPRDGRAHPRRGSPAPGLGTAPPNRSSSGCRRDP
ncbi:transposase [Streptomyces sp. NBC_00212]|uniref:transposase n=1 Tax=Streptomyces sp. NBC_00212 TaxID=2975684 RepID=UPI00386EEC24